MILSMLRRQVTRLVALALLAPMTGCLAPRSGDYVISHPVSFSDASTEADALWDAAQEALRRNGFQLDRVDRGAGLITTLPLTSQHFFEIWRHDVDTREDAWESTLNAMRRRADVVVHRDDDGKWRELSVVVRKERYSAPDRQFNSTGAAYQFFGGLLPAMSGAVRIMAEDEQWLDRGRDAAMEAYLLRRILDRVVVVGDADPPASG